MIVRVQVRATRINRFVCDARFCAAVLSCMIFGVATTLSAQESALHVIDVGELKLDYRTVVGGSLERLETFGDPSIKRKSYELILGQQLGLDMDGSFIHPLFWSWEVAGSGFFIADFVWGDIPNPDLPKLYRGNQFDLQPGFDARFDFLKEHPYPVSAYANRRTEIIRRDFQRDYWLSTTSIGGNASWHNPDYPLNANYSYMLQEGDESDDIVRGRQSGSQIHRLYVGGRDPHIPSLISTEYRMSALENEYFPDTNYLLHSGLVNSTPFFDRTRDYRFDLKVLALHREFAEEQMSDVKLTQRIVTKLIPSLQLTEQFNTGWSRVFENDFLLNSVSLELRHQLFNSLTTTALGRAGHKYGENLRNQEATLAGGVKYRKDLGPVIMTHGYDAMGTWTSDSGESFVPVTDESVTFEGPEDMEALERHNVDLNSVEVLDSTREIRYVRGFDYELNQTDDGTTYIRRLLGGDIAEGARVLVSYIYEFDGDEKSSQLDQRYFSRLDTDIWTFLIFYAQYSYRNVSYESDVFSDSTIDDLIYHEARVGSHFSKFQLSVDTHFGYSFSRDYEAYEFSSGAAYPIPFSKAFQPILGVRNLYRILYLENEEERKNLFEIYSQASYPISESVTGDWRISYRWEAGGNNDGHGVWGVKRVNWHLREVVFSAEYSLDLHSREIQFDQRHTLLFIMRRGF